MLRDMAALIERHAETLETWYHNKLIHGSRCLYNSVDLRYSGMKLVPVDVNIFPAGFNNLNRKELQQASLLVKNYVELHHGNINKILLIGEDNRRNLHYLDNLKTLYNIINAAGYQCKIGSLLADNNESLQGNIHSDINIAALERNGNKLQTIDGFVPDLIILNNDLMTGMPDKLDALEQTIIPHPHNGWFKRRKSQHFLIYNQLVQELEELFGLPCFLLTTEFSICERVNFKTNEGIDRLAKKVEELLLLIQKKYDQYNIQDKPYIVIKSDYGTYGMGVMIIHSADEIYSLNKKYRKQMHITKNNIINDQVIIQEGIRTIDTIDNKVAEPLLYFIDHQLVSFLYRKHDTKNEYSNLNSVGMEIVNNQIIEADYYKCCNFIARLSSLAAALELNRYEH